jgi:hypothetical protein
MDLQLKNSGMEKTRASFRNVDDKSTIHTVIRTLFCMPDDKRPFAMLCDDTVAHALLAATVHKEENDAHCHYHFGRPDVIDNGVRCD